MIKNRWIRLIIFLCVLLIISACQSDVEETTDVDDESESLDESKNANEASDDSKLDFAYSAQPPTLDLHVTTAIAASDIMRHVYETLITVDEDYNIQPLLADSWEQSDDGKTYTFNLREGILFHNGQEMKADDVAASMNRWMDLPGSSGQFVDATFEVVDDYVVELKLQESLSTTLPALAHGGAGLAAIMPKEVIDEADPDGVDEHIGTGPFKFIEWEQDQHVHLTKFADYQPRQEEADGLAGKREALVNDIKFHFVADSSTREAGIRSGEYDIAQSMTYDNAEVLESDDNIENIIYPGGFLVLHFNKRAGLFADQKAREAVATALEMDSIMTAAYAKDDYFHLTHNFMMTHQHPQWDSDVGHDKYNVNDPEKAKQLLDEVGYDGETIRIITTRDYEDQYQGSVVVQQQLEGLGMDVDLEIYDWPTLLDKREDEGAYEIYIIGNVSVPEPSATVFLLEDYAGWTDSDDLRSLVAEYRGKPTLEEAKSLFDDFQDFYWDYIPAIKIGDFNRVSSMRSTVKNVKYQDGFVLWNVTNNID